MTGNGTVEAKVSRIDERTQSQGRRLDALETCLQDLEKDLQEVKASQGQVLQMISDGKRILGWILAPVLGSMSLALLAAIAVILAKRGG